VGICAQQVGTTRSLKAIMQPLNTDEATLKQMTATYTSDDHFDAFAVFQYLLSREIATVGADSPRIKVYDDISLFHVQMTGSVEFKRQKSFLRLLTIFDIINFGYSRSHAFFVN